MGYTKEALRGVTWIWILRILTRGFSFLRIAIIARVLTPNLFGLYGIAALALSLVEVFTESGINVFIIQEKEKLKKIVSTAWIVSIVRGIIIFLIIILSAQHIANFFNSPRAYFLILVISIVPLIKGFINPSIIRFQKDLEFKKEFHFRLAIFAIESILSIIFVYILRDPVGIIYGLIMGAIFEVMISFLFVKPIPRFNFDKTKLKKILSRGKWITTSGIFNYLYHNADDVVVGRILGTSSLGLYDMTYKISTLPITEVADVVSRVIFPIYTKFSDDSIRLKRAFIKTIGGVSVITIPIGLILFFFPEKVIEIVLGPLWLDAVPVLKILGFFGVIRAISGTTSALFLAVKKQELVTIVTFVSLLGLAVSILPLVAYYGLVGAALASLVGTISAVPIMIYFTIKVFSGNEKSNSKSLY